MISYIKLPIILIIIDQLPLEADDRMGIVLDTTDQLIVLFIIVRRKRVADAMAVLKSLI